MYAEKEDRNLIGGANFLCVMHWAKTLTRWNHSNENYSNNMSQKEYNKSWRELNKEKIKADKAEWYRKNKKSVLLYSKQYYVENKDRIRIYQRDNKEKIKSYYVNNKDKILENSKRGRYKNEYGITVKDYDTMLQTQNNRCAICYKSSNTLCVDHNHVTGKVRGLLCKKCNIGIGCLNDDAEILANAIKYLSL